MTSPAIHETWDEDTDLLIFGAGAAGLSAACVGLQEGLSVILCEKAAQVGGTTATSGGTVWVPGTRLSARDSVPDTIEAGRTYLKGEFGNWLKPDLLDAFLEAGDEAIAYYERHTDLKLKAARQHPDYHPDRPGGTLGCRALLPVPFDARLLGSDFRFVRPPMPEFMALGGMMVGREEIPLLVRPFSSWRAFKLTMQLGIRHASDRLRYPRGTRLLMGNALVARLFWTLRKRKADLRLNTALVELVRGSFGIEGAIVQGSDGRRKIRARRGVLLATGGFGASESWRNALMGHLGIAHFLTAETTTGDALTAARAVGAGLDLHQASPGFWMPASVVRYRNGKSRVFPHIRDRAKPGLIAVNSTGRRFVNEANSYQDFVTAMFESHRHVPSIPAHLICDRAFVRDYGLGVIRPVWQRLKPYIDSGYVTTADTIEELAARIGVPPASLARTVADHNRYAATGIDEEFGKGSNALNRHNGDAQNKPNPCLRPIATPPFFAVAVHPAPLGTSAGLATNADAEVLDERGAPIANLYACGNDMGSVMRGTYPGPGITLGPALVFAYRAVRHMTRVLAQKEAA